MTATAKALVFRDVTCRFGDVVALNRVTLELDAGVTALVGPNGAGKSSFMKAATGQVRPVLGRIEAFGQPIWDNPAALARLGYVPEQDAFYESMTGIDFVTSLAILSGLSHGQARAAAEAELTALGLTEAWERPIKTYSKGMRQRVKLAQALVHQPDLLFLDEPLLGCDPIARRRIQDRVHGLASEGCTVLMASHILPEVERLTRRIAILSAGRLVAQGDAGQVRDALTQIPSRVRIQTGAPRAVAADLSSWDDVQAVRIQNGAVELETSRLRATLERLHTQPGKAWALRGIETMDDDLDSLFGYLAEGT
ncbi:MAG: ABC transporter ATP-binding protein [Thermoplasmatota archaeon]